MGLFTTIIHPEDGRKLQIKTDWDVLEVLKIGDKKKKHKKFSDAYISRSKYGEDDWVIIKHGKVFAFEPKDTNELGIITWAMLQWKYPFLNERHEDEE